MERSRRAALWSVPPLWLIGVCLFLPTVRSCDHMESPAQLVRGQPLFMSGMLSPFLLAELLAVVVIVALARRHVGKWLGRAALSVGLLALASPAILAVCDLATRHLDEQAWGLFAVGNFAVAAWVLWRARAASGFDRLALVVGAFTAATVPLATLLARILVEDGRRNVGVGGWCFLAATAALVAIQLALLRSRDTIAS